MSDGPQAAAKWSKYSVEDGKLVRKSEFCPKCGWVFYGYSRKQKVMWPMWIHRNERVNQPMWVVLAP